MNTVDTALGPVATAELGPTLHEHIVARSPGVSEDQIDQMLVRNPRAIFEARKPGRA